jgi:hypothetical protein
MIRRGTAYGSMLPEGVTEDDGIDRGLMFAFVGDPADAGTEWRRRNRQARLCAGEFAVIPGAAEKRGSLSCGGLATRGHAGACDGHDLLEANHPA